VPRIKSKRISVVFFLVIGSINFGWAQPLNYQDIFGHDWQNALAFVGINKNWVEPKLDKYNISYPMAIAVVFPELVRYSAVRDKIEITLLKALYINLGNDYADFSIGPFQMKPSFAEMVREKATIVMGRKSKSLFKNRSEYTDNKTFRAAIVTELEDPETEINYLIAFFKICESSFNIKWKDENDKLRFFATAYNYGFNKKAEQIKSMTDKKFFNTRVFKTDNFSYADIASFWYKQYIAESLISNPKSSERRKR
jgi:hypothetical protein